MVPALFNTQPGDGDGDGCRAVVEAVPGTWEYGG
jgi:hypothetical protein